MGNYVNVVENFSGGVNSIERLYLLNDASNFGRVMAFNDALAWVFSDYHFVLSGVSDYMSSNVQAQSVPHNWVAMSLVNYGILFTALYFLYLIRLLVWVDIKVFPVMASLIFVASFLGTFPLLAPFLLLVLSLYLPKPY